jgi:hypothetical protein
VVASVVVAAATDEAAASMRTVRVEVAVRPSVSVAT